MLTAERLREVLHYDAETGVWMWRIAVSRRIHVGDVAGWLDGDGYLEIGVDRRVYLSHRLAFLYMTGSWPKDQVDHANLDKADNRWKNLREATSSQNNANRKTQKNNVCGQKGIRPHGPSWRARMTINGCVNFGPSRRNMDAAIADHHRMSKAAFGEFARAE